MKLKNVLIIVKNMEKSIAFYKELFGLEVILDNDGNVIMTEGLVLQDIKCWEQFLGRDCIPCNNMSELYFEEKDMTHSWGQKVIRFYDPDGNLIEVGTPMQQYENGGEYRYAVWNAHINREQNL